MGEGQFSRVVEAVDRSTGAVVAVKVIRAIRRYTESAAVECEILERVRAAEHASGARPPIVGYHGCFRYRGHACLVFDWCGVSLYDFLTRNGDIPFAPAAVRAVARQLGAALAFLHGIGLIHTDLKTENVMLCCRDYDTVPLTPRTCACPTAPAAVRSATTRVPRALDVRLIDLGNAVWNTRPHRSVIGTRHYRPPEVLLGAAWACPSDLWSVGCILVELHTGQTLFQTHHNREHLAMIERVLGPFPPALLRRASRTALARYFDARGRVVFPEPGSGESTAYVDAMRPLAEIIPPDTHPDLHDLVRRLLTYEPELRITAAEMTLHPFCSSSSGSSSTVTSPLASSVPQAPSPAPVDASLLPSLSSLTLSSSASPTPASTPPPQPAEHSHHDHHHEEHHSRSNHHGHHEHHHHSHHHHHPHSHSHSHHSHDHYSYHSHYSHR